MIDKLVNLGRYRYLSSGHLVHLDLIGLLYDLLEHGVLISQHVDLVLEYFNAFVTIIEVFLQLFLVYDACLLLQL